MSEKNDDKDDFTTLKPITFKALIKTSLEFLIPLAATVGAIFLFVKTFNLIDSSTPQLIDTLKLDPQVLQDVQDNPEFQLRLEDFFKTKEPSLTLTFPPTLDLLRENISSVENRVKTLEAQLKEISRVPERAALAIQLKGVEKSVNDVHDSLSKIEDVIADDPLEVLSAALLAKDIETSRREINRLQIELDRYFYLGVGQFASVGCLIIAVVVLIFQNMRRRTKEG